MGTFGSILAKIFHHIEVNASPTAPVAAAVAPSPTSTAAAGPATTLAPGKLGAVDVEAVLSKLADSKGGGNGRTSIVDLLKLLDLDSSVAARKDLAQELGVHAGTDGSAEQNIALQKAAMSKLVENGGKVPDSLRSVPGSCRPMGRCGYRVAVGQHGRFRGSVAGLYWELRRWDWRRPPRSCARYAEACKLIPRTKQQVLGERMTSVIASSTSRHDAPATSAITSCKISLNAGDGMGLFIA